MTTAKQNYFTYIDNTSDNNDKTMTIDKQNYFTYIDNTSDDNDKTTENSHKQNIIDDVDVSKCEAFDSRNGWCSFWEEHCSKNPDCIHKKYYRKEQQCEELKEENKKLKEEILDLQLQFEEEQLMYEI